MVLRDQYGINMKKIVITGARGLVARYVIDVLSNSLDNEIYAISSHKEIIQHRYDRKNVSCIDNDQLRTEYKQILANAYIIHCAFTRKNDGIEVAKSMDYSSEVFSLAKEAKAKRIINISTRSIYKEPDAGCLNVENSPINAGGAISAGKYGVELLLDAYFKGSMTEYVNLRLASVNELKRDDTMVRPLNVFVQNVIDGKDIRIIGGSQVMSYIDPRDVAEAIKKIVEASSIKEHTYNLGTGWMCTDTLYNMACKVIKIGKEFGYINSSIIKEDKVIDQRAGLDISRLSGEVNWEPYITLDIMIKDLFNMLKN